MTFRDECITEYELAVKNNKERQLALISAELEELFDITSYEVKEFHSEYKVVIDDVELQTKWDGGWGGMRTYHVVTKCDKCNHWVLSCAVFSREDIGKQLFAPSLEWHTCNGKD